MKKLRKKLCKQCGKRRAIFKSKSDFKWDKCHTLCRQCYRSLCDRYRVIKVDFEFFQRQEEKVA